MSLGVQSYPELYTTLLGFQQYERIWGILVHTGLAFLPFIGMLLTNFAKPYESQETKESTLISLRRVEIDFAVMIFIIMFAVQPLIPLSPSVLGFSPSCSQTADTLHPGETGTTYDKAFPAPTTVKVPLWWYAVIAVSEGITSALTSDLGCVPDLRSMITQAKLTQIHDPELRQQIQLFDEQCFVPARYHYLQSQNQSSSSQFTRYGQKYGPSDTEWFGSHSFSELPGYYDQITAKEPIRGFPFNAQRDWQENQLGEKPAWGKPSCKEWWENSQYGLKGRLYDAFPKDLWHLFGNLSDKNKDDLLKSILTGAPHSYDNANHLIGDWGYSHVAEMLGAVTHQFNEYPKLYAIEQAAPIVRALLLLMVYAFLPFALVFGRYRPKTLITGSLLIFSLIFWSYLWHFVQWVDQALIKALYGNWLFEQSPQATIADIITGSMMMVLPLFWFSMMSALGVAAGNAVQGVWGNIFAPAISSANSGAQMIKKEVTSMTEAAKAAVKTEIL